MIAIGKRLLNVLMLLCTLYLVVLLFIMASSGVANWYEFVGINFGLLTVGYAAIITVNYVALGTVTLWHKTANPSQDTSV